MQAIYGSTFLDAEDQCTIIVVAMVEHLLAVFKSREIETGIVPLQLK